MDSTERWSGLAVCIFLGLLLLPLDAAMCLRVGSGVFYLPVIFVSYWILANKKDVLLLAKVFSFLPLLARTARWQDIDSYAVWSDAVIGIGLMWLAGIVIVQINEDASKRRPEIRIPWQPLSGLLSALGADIARQDRAMRVLSRSLQMLAERGLLEASVVQHFSKIVEIHHRLDQEVQAIDNTMSSHARSHEIKACERPADGGTELSEANQAQEHEESIYHPVDFVKGRPRQPRRPFNFPQSIAPYSGGPFPSREEFYDVQGYDISTDGFSFLVPQPPPFEMLVVALGTRSRRTLVSARVTDVSETPNAGFLVNCDFNERLGGFTLTR